MKYSILALPLALMMAAGSAIAADPIEKQVTITATIPTESFYVEPVGGNWMNEPQDMAWNSFQQTLQPIRKQLQVRSTTGPISAYLLNPATITSGADTIGLDVSVAGKALTLTSSEVISEEQAAPGAIVGFEVAAQTAGAGGYTPGNYLGVVNMMFETTTE
ncbi:CS1 type fimbrial major subunit [Pseudomonas sp. 148P]|uniref:CS1 type fimbrial major subunit n=1 Tax=Pseudomonas ulcerans TaxID=3115852 RepID=A0ABU7HNI4_9PSED|nr:MULTISPECIES: CS1 type fimbrial major subunit [unclassified Pseudomonas]MEE1923594.1 CS1 type fimbrial major subunit [Pseudomonas sp. 147P]MEE1933092.1 CS1 type fimbrial major subunit [Pseudomonas sp. 148P]